MNLNLHLWALALLAVTPLLAQGGASEEICTAYGKSHVHPGKALSSEDPVVVNAGNTAVVTACNLALQKLGLGGVVKPGVSPFSTPLKLPVSSMEGKESRTIFRKVTFNPREFSPPPNLSPQKLQNGVYYVPSTGIVAAEVEATMTLVYTAGDGRTEQQIVPPTVEKREGRDEQGRKYDYLFRIYSSYSWTYGQNDMVDMTDRRSMPIQNFVNEILDTPQVRATLKESRLLVVVGTASEEHEHDRPMEEYERAGARAFLFHQALKPLIRNTARHTAPPTFMLNLGRYQGGGHEAQAKDKRAGNGGKNTMAQRPLVLVSLIHAEQQEEDISDEDLRHSLLEALEGHLLDPERYEGNPEARGTFELRRIESDMRFLKPQSARGR